MIGFFGVYFAVFLLLKKTFVDKKKRCYEKADVLRTFDNIPKFFTVLPKEKIRYKNIIFSQQKKHRAFFLEIQNIQK